MNYLNELNKKKEIRIIYCNGVSYVIEKCPGEHDIDKRRSWIQEQILLNDTSTYETSTYETSKNNTSTYETSTYETSTYETSKNNIQKIIRMSLFWLNSNMGECKWKNHA